MAPLPDPTPNIDLSLAIDGKIMTSVSGQSLSVGIVTYGFFSEEMKSCLSSLQDQLRGEDRVVIIHEGSKSEFEKIKNLASSYEITSDCIALSESKGLSNGRNLAIKHCKTIWLAFIDDDAVLLEGWRESFERGVHQYPDSAGFTGPIIPIYGSGSRILPNEMEWIVSCESSGGGDDKLVRNAFGANMTINAKLARNLGIFFDPSFGAVGGTEGTALAGEEAIFSMKIRDASGKQIMWLHDLTVGHNVPRSRTNLSYVLHRSIKEGRTKAVIRKSEKIFGPKNSVLSKEISHLFRTVFIGIPIQIVRSPISPISSFWNTIGIITMLFGTAWGFLATMIMK